VDPERRAKALEALRIGRPAPSQASTFWSQHGGKVMLAAVLALGLWLVAGAVGRFMHTSISETERSEEVLRSGMRR
jgi:hypothetical protein